jgi:hypothetical protein
MPWYHRESTFAQDYTIIKHWITVSPSAPCAFPTTEWENIIKGKSVNLDSVLSSLHHISAVKENIGHVGSTEISLGCSNHSCFSYIYSAIGLPDGFETKFGKGAANSHESKSQSDICH